jgi:hypothetical protein
MAIPPCLGHLLASFGDARRLLSDDGTRRPNRSYPQHPPVVHLAHALGGNQSLAVFDLAFLAHSSKVRADWDRFRVPLTDFSQDFWLWGMPPGEHDGTVEAWWSPAGYFSKVEVSVDTANGDIRFGWVITDVGTTVVESPA